MEQPPRAVARGRDVDRARQAGHDLLELGRGGRRLGGEDHGEHGQEGRGDASSGRGLEGGAERRGPVGHGVHPSHARGSRRGSAVGAILAEGHQTVNSRAGSASGAYSRTTVPSLALMSG